MQNENTPSKPEGAEQPSGKGLPSSVLFGISDVTDDILDAVENEVGMGCGAWDMVPPKEIIAAAWKFLPND